MAAMCDGHGECFRADEECERLRASLREMRDACAAAMRIICLYDLNVAFFAEVQAIGIADGFGTRADALLRKPREEE